MSHDNVIPFKDTRNLPKLKKLLAEEQLPYVSVAEASDIPPNELLIAIVHEETKSGTTVTIKEKSGHGYEVILDLKYVGFGSWYGRSKEEALALVEAELSTTEGQTGIVIGDQSYMALRFFYTEMATGYSLSTALAFPPSMNINLKVIDLINNIKNTLEVMTA